LELFAEAVTMFCGTVVGKHCCICCEAHRVQQKLCSSNYCESHKRTFTCTVVMCHTCKYFPVCILYRQEQWTYFCLCDF